MVHATNRILNALPADELRLITPLLTRTLLKQHTILFETRTTVDRIHFPHDAAVSLVTPLSTGETVETAMVGHDGLIGGFAVQDGRVALSRAIVQLEGHAQHCAVDALRGIVGRCPTLHDLIGRHEHVLLAQTQQSAACNVTHPVESRLARWLLRACDLRGSDELFLTQEYLAEMLGVGRTTVSLTAHTLQAAGLISYRRGRIRIDKIEALKEVACECYEAVKLNYATLNRAETNA